MKMKICKECQSEIPNAATTCRYCGRKGIPVLRESHFGGWFLCALAAAVVIGAITNNGTSSKTYNINGREYAAVTPQVERAQRPGRSEATSTCMDAVRNSAKYPSKTDFYMFDFATAELPGIGWQVTGKVDLMNGFGAKIPHVFLCETSVDGNTVLINVVSPE